jgi:hypothetical protein
MRIINQIRNWWHSEKRAHLAALRKDYKYRLEIARLTHQLADTHCFKWDECVDTRSGSWAETPVIFQLNLALTLRVTYNIDMVVKDIRLAEDVDDLASTVLRRIATRDATVWAALEQAVRRPV